MLRIVEILWTFTRRGLIWTVYRDVVRHRLTNPHCECADDHRAAQRARRLRKALERLGPTFIKLGQFVSRRPDIVPSAYLKELAALQDAAPPISFREIRQRLEEVCICHQQQGAHRPKPSCLHCQHIEGVFDEFSSEAVASASLAQVHRAVFQGKHVAVKVLKPGVLDHLNRDLKLLYRLRWLVGRALGVGRHIHVAGFLAEFRQRLLEEVNFEYEALNIDRFRDTHPHDGPVGAPAVHWEFERSDLLVMEFVDGVSVKAWQGTRDEARRLAETLARDFLQQVFIDNFFHADPHPGNLIVEPSGRIVYLDFGAVGQLEPLTRRAVLKLLRSILQTDPDLAVDAVLEAGGTDRSLVDLVQLRIDVDRIIQLYRRRGGVRWTDAIVETAHRNGLRLPRSILQYAKAAILNESLVTELNPEFQVLPIVQEMVHPIIERELSAFASQLQRDLPAAAEDYAKILKDLPMLIRQWSEAKAVPD